MRHGAPTYEGPELQELILKQQETIAKQAELIREKDKIIQEKEAELADKEHFIRLLQKMVFGKKSERVISNPNQMSFSGLFTELNGVAQSFISQMKDKVEAVIATEEREECKAKGHGRKPFPDSISSEREVHRIPEESRMCCGKPMKKKFEKVSKRLEYVPACFKIIEEVKEVYGCDICKESIMVSPGRNHLIEKGNCRESVLAHVIVSKYMDHTPLYRMERILKRHGVDISSSTIVDWIANVAHHIRPVVRCMEEEVKKSPCINTDDTGIAVLFNKGKEKKDKAHHGYMWVYQAGSDVVVFKYSPDRSGKRPADFLKGYEGYLQCDGFNGYDALFESNKMVEVNCWQHAKRKFLDAKESDKERAEAAVNLINMLYRVEHIADEEDLSDRERLHLRQSISADIVNTLHSWLHENDGQVLPRSPIKKAINYTMNQWPGLTTFLKDPTLELDNNRSERAMRHIVMGRKNWLFAGSENGARRMADIYSLIYSCHLNQIEPFVYLKDILEKIADNYPQSQIDDLTPKGWKKKYFQPLSASLMESPGNPPSG